jgi:hypothetical protein
MDDKLRYWWARLMMTQSTLERLPKRPMLPHAIHRRGPVGSGKTRDEMEKLAKDTFDPKVVYTGLSNRLVKESHDNYLHTYRGQQTALHYVGNDYVSEDGKEFGCHEDMRDVRALFGRAGGDPPKLCGMEKDDDGNVHFSCARADTCMISKQLRGGADIFFTPTATLQHPMKGYGKATPNRPAKKLRIDETLQQLRTIETFSPEVLIDCFPGAPPDPAIKTLGEGMELSPSERMAAAAITVRREFINREDKTKGKWKQAKHWIPGVAEKAMWTKRAFFDVLAIREITATLRRLEADPHGGRITRRGLPRFDELFRLLDLFSQTLIQRPSRFEAWSNPTLRQKEKMNDLAVANSSPKRAALFLKILIDLMALPPMHDTVPGIRVLPKNKTGEPRVSLGNIIPIHASYHTDDVEWLDATGSPALAAMTHFAEVTPDPPEPANWNLGPHCRVVKLMHRQDGPRARWTANRLFDDDGNLTDLGWMLFVTEAHLMMEHLSAKGDPAPKRDDLLRVTTKAVLELAPLGLVGLTPDNFMKVNGSNRYEKSHAQSIILSSASTPRNSWEIVEAIDGIPREDPGVWWEPTEHEVYVKETNEVVTTTINSHPDPLFAEYYKETATADFHQAWRLRSQWRDDATLYIIANNEPLPPGIDLDRLIFVEERGGWYHHAAAHFGIAPVISNGRFSRAYSHVVAALLPERFKDAGAVRDHADHRREQYEETPATLDGTHGFASALPIAIRLPGGSTSQWVIGAVDRKEATVKIEKLKRSLPGAEFTLKNARKKI